MGDTSDKVMAATFYLVSKHNVGGIQNTFCSNITNTLHLANSAIKSLPFLELSALAILSENLSLLLDICSENGFKVHPKNVLIFTDSSTTILWCRSLSVRYSKRVEGKISQIFLNFQENHLNSYSNLYFFKQKIAKYYPPDILTKSTTQNANQTLLNLQKVSQPPFFQQKFSDWPITLQDYLPANKMVDKNLIVNLLETKNQITLEQVVEDTEMPDTDTRPMFLTSCNKQQPVPDFLDLLVKRNITNVGTRSVSKIFGIMLLYINKLRLQSKLPDKIRILNKQKLLMQVNHLLPCKNKVISAIEYNKIDKKIITEIEEINE